MSQILVNADNFVRAESDLMFSRVLTDTGGVGAWMHYRVPAPLDHQNIIRLNRDTLYSVAIVDVSAGATLVLPAAGERYLSAMVVSQDHFIPLIVHDPGEHHLDRDLVGTDFALLGVRTLVDPSDPDDVAEVNRLQDLIELRSGATRDFELPDYEPQSHRRTREALIRLADDLPDYQRAFGRAGEVDPVRHLIAAASGWGGLPEYEANYVNVTPGLPVGDYRLRLADVPVDAFWSISLYNAEGYFEPNDLGVNNINSLTAVPDGDGAVTVHFGTEPAGRANFLPIMPGWNFLIRMYQPRPAAFDGTWVSPQIEAIG